MTIKPLIDDPIKFVREHPRMFLGDAEFQPGPVAGFICYSAVLLTGREAMLLQNAEWWAIGCRSDWIGMLQSNVGNVFQSLIAFPEHRANSFHHEILLTAFATNVVILTPNDVNQIKGDDQSKISILKEWMRIENLNRVVAFS
jgi:hypothetical protein